MCENAKFFKICTEKVKTILKIKNIVKLDFTAHSMCNLKYSVHKKIPIVFHSRFSYDYQFIIKEL